jgi:hypothetical protein
VTAFISSRPLSLCARLKVVHNPSHAFFEQSDIEVDEQSQPLFREAQVGQELFEVHGREGLD